MLDTQSEVLDVERRIEALHENVPKFVRGAGVHVSTWRRWRNGETEANRRTWKRITTALEALEARKAQEAKIGEAA